MRRWLHILAIVPALMMAGCASAPPPAVAPLATAPIQIDEAKLRNVIVAQSREEYLRNKGPCPCPYSKSSGRMCGGNSAYSRPGGATVYCYPADVPATVVQKQLERLTASN
jgi:hypothetical protein